MNYIRNIAKMFGVELEEHFRVKSKHFPGYENDTFWFNEDAGLCRRTDDGWEASNSALIRMLMGQIEVIQAPWRPEHCEKMYYVDTDSKIGDVIFYKDHPFHMAMLAMGNCFRTKADAERNKDEMLKCFEEVRNGG